VAAVVAVATVLPGSLATLDEVVMGPAFCPPACGGTARPTGRARVRELPTQSFLTAPSVRLDASKTCETNRQRPSGSAASGVRAPPSISLRFDRSPRRREDRVR
jgi:hypothetical protein